MCHRSKKYSTSRELLFVHTFLFILILFLISLFAHVKFRNIAAPPTLNESSWSLFIICVFSFYLPPALPDLVIDTAELQKTIVQEYRTLYDLRCAHEESCLSKSADALFKYESTLLQKQRSITSLGPSHLALVNQLMALSKLTT